MKKMMLSVAVCLSSLASATAEDWGTVSGQVVVTGEIPALELLHKKDGPVKDPQVCAVEDTYKDDLLIDKDSKGIANVFIYMAKKPKSIHPDLEKPKDATVVFDQKGCMFKPHAMVVRVGQSVEVISGDAIAHNTHTNPLKNDPTNVVIAANTKVGMGVKIENLKTSERLPFRVSCDYHPWMLAQWLVVDHPYAVISDKDGKFSIPNVPVGEHEFVIWHERKGYIERKLAVKVAKGDNVLKTVEVKVEDLTKKP